MVIGLFTRNSNFFACGLLNTGYEPSDRPAALQYRHESGSATIARLRASAARAKQPTREPRRRFTSGARGQHSTRPCLPSSASRRLSLTFAAPEQGSTIASATAFRKCAGGRLRISGASKAVIARDLILGNLRRLTDIPICRLLYQQIRCRSDHTNGVDV